MKKVNLIMFMIILSVVTFSKTVVFTTTERIPYVGEKLENNGYVVEIVTEALKRKGYDVKIDFYPEARSLAMVEKGQADGVLPVYKSKSGEKNLIFSDPMPGNTIGLLKRKDYNFQFKNSYLNNPAGFLKELSGKRVGLVRGRVYDDKFDKSRNYKKDMALNDLLNLRKLANNRMDFAVMDKYSAADLMVTREPQMIGKLEFVAPIANQAFHIGFSKQKPGISELLNDFNQGLREITADGTLDKILEKFGFDNNLAVKKESTKKKIKIGTVNNGDMLVMQKLSKEYEKLNPDVEIEWKVLDENILRTRLLSSLAISDDKFDVMTIGAYEAPIWAKNNWLQPLNNLPSEYDVDDIIDSVRKVLEYNNILYALPFYAESSMTYYRKDLFEKAGIKMPANPTYDDIKRFAAKLNNPSAGFYGIGLRGKAGWGDNMALVTTMVNGYAGRWFDESWNPQINSDSWKKALEIYKELIISYGPKGTENNSFNENKELMANGKIGMWIDATVAAGMLFDKNQSKVYDKIGFAPAPKGTEDEGSNWLWAWSLAIPSSSKNSKEALDFITWATSKEYINLVGDKIGWVSVPAGTRKSTYSNKKYIEVAPFANFVYDAIKTANPKLSKAPYKGIQYVAIPEFPAIGGQVAEKVREYLMGELELDALLEEANKIAEKQMNISGYTK